MYLKNYCCMVAKEVQCGGNSPTFRRNLLLIFSEQAPHTLTKKAQLSWEPFVQENMTSYPRRRQPCNHRQGELKSPSIQHYLSFLLFVFSGLVTGHVSDIEEVCVRCCPISLQALNTQSHNKVAPGLRQLVSGSVFILNSVVMGMSVSSPVQFTSRRTRGRTRKYRCYIPYSFKYFVQFKPQPD